jgi:hypothetical protein
MRSKLFVRLIGVLIALASPLIGYAQEVTLSGTVTDHENYGSYSPAESQANYGRPAGGWSTRIRSTTR